MGSVHSTPEPSGKYFQWPVRIQSVEDCVSYDTMVEHCVFNLATPLRTVLQDFTHIQSICYWIKIEKAGQTQG